MFAYLIRQLYAMDSSVDFYVHNGNIYVTKGQAEVYPCVVAHMDTVHDICEDLTVLQAGDLLTGFNTVTMKQTGIGGDDKVGIFIALQTLDKFDNVKVAFFRDEEVGCNGSYVADMTFFDNVSMVIQCDRRGDSDFVHTASGTKMASKDFIKQVSKLLRTHKYSIQSGMMTDVMALKENGLNVSACNLSCGYHRPHCADEYVDITHVEKCMNLVFDMIETMGATKWTHKPEVTYGKPWYKGDYRGYNNAFEYYAGSKFTGNKKADPSDYYDDFYWDNEEYRWDYYQHKYVKKTTVEKLFGVDERQEHDEYDDGIATCDSCFERKVVHYDHTVNGLLCDGCAKTLHG
jgi:hypothetical protein